MEEKHKYTNVAGKEIEVKVEEEEANDAIMQYVELNTIERTYPLLKVGESTIEIILAKPTSLMIRMIERTISEKAKEQDISNQEAMQIRNTAYVAVHLKQYGDNDFKETPIEKGTHKVVVEKTKEAVAFDYIMKKYYFIEELVPNMRTALIDRVQHFATYCEVIFSINSLENF